MRLAFKCSSGEMLKNVTPPPYAQIKYEEDETKEHALLTLLVQ